jgi:hypothetical protein
MNRDGPKAHLRQALNWSTEAELHWVEMLGAGIGLAAPILAGAALGELRVGLIAAVGSLMVGGLAVGPSLRAQARRLLAILVPAAAAAVAAALLARHGRASDVALVLLAGVAAVAGGFSRPMAAATTRFVLCLMIAAAIAEEMPQRALLVALILAGAVWTGAVGLALGALARALRRPQAPSAAAAAAAAEPTRAQKLRRWQRSLAGLAGWQYPLRLTGCLAIAIALKWLWPNHHLHWIALTIALLMERPVESFPVRTTQRALGTTLGVAITDLIGAHTLPVWLIVAASGALAALRPLLRARNYLLYSVVMTPLVIVILDAGRPVAPDVLLERLVATLIGAALVIGANLLFRRLLPGPT